MSQSEMIHPCTKQHTQKLYCDKQNSSPYNTQFTPNLSDIFRLCRLCVRLNAALFSVSDNAEKRRDNLSQ